MLNIRTLLLFAIILLAALIAFFAETYFYLSDCSVGGVRDSAMIDDVDKTSGCLSKPLRLAGLIITPLIWGVVTWMLIKAFKNK